MSGDYLFKRTLWFAAAACVAGAGPALAQQPAKAPAKSAQTPAGMVGEIVVEGAPPPVRVDAEKKSFSLKDDLQATTGSIADALRDVPSVDVDVQGNVSLRGDANVTIMIDGKPSGMFKGEGRGQALQSLPADQIERVEVMTNPSAAYNPEGSGGIINLITKKTAKPGVNGSVRANVGLGGRANGGANASWRSGPFSLTGDVSLRRDHPGQRYTDIRTFRTPGGVITETKSSASTGDVGLESGRIGLDYDLDDKTRLSATTRYQTIIFAFEGVEPLERLDPAGARLRRLDSNVGQRQGRQTFENTVSFTHKYGENHDLGVTFTRELNDEDRSRVFLRTPRFPVSVGTVEDGEYRNRAWRTQLKVDYARPIGEAKLKLGYEFNGDDNDYRLVFAATPLGAPAAIDPTRSNLFRFDQQVHGLYATYEKPFGKLTALAGVRAESTRIDLDQVTQGRKDENDYVRVYPSLNLTWRVDDAQQVTASASRRVQRPQPTEYNSLVIFLDDLNQYAGNPRLKPQITDALELGYQYRKSGSTYLATAYYRNGRDSTADVFRDLGGGSIFQTRENIGSFQSAGLELAANGKLPGRVSYNVSASLAWNEIDASDLGFGARVQSGYSLGGRASLTWEVTDKDTLQLQGYAIGERLYPQARSDPQALVNLGYRHKFSDKLSGVVTVQDALKLSRFATVLDTATYREVIVGYPRNRALFFGLTYNFGGGKPRDPGFDFGSGND